MFEFSSHRTGLRGFVVSLAALLLHCDLSSADEGMWLYNHPPTKLLREKYQFDATTNWLAHLQKSSVRFGASAEFVSADGLLLSNHHVGSRALQKLSTKEHNFLRDGFYAPGLADEKPCPGVELDVLMSIEDVTPRVNAAITEGMSGQQAFAARRSVMAAIEKESLDQTGLRSDVVTLYQGAQFHLYRYKTYTDVRLVFAPEEQIAFYGGDPDNFEYPRFDLDICLFRVYENGKPAQVTDYLKWSKTGVAEGDLVFVSGNPGRTDRLRTMAELQFLRDYEYPHTLARLKRIEVLLAAFGARSDENARRARTDLFGTRNSRKARDGGLAGLMDPKLLSAKQEAEDKLRAAVGSKPELAYAQGAWDRIAQAQKNIAMHSLEYDFLERAQGFSTVLFDFARELIRVAEEHSKPNGERLEEYQDSARASLELRLLSEQPIYADLETLKLSDSLTYLAESLGYDSPVVQRVLAGKSPRERAFQLVSGTHLATPALRRKLYEGGADTLGSASDPMIELARLVDPDARAVRKSIDVERETIRQAHALIERARFALEGQSTYPDATSTLRLAFGVVKGYEEDGHSIPFETTMAGLYQRAEDHNYKPSFDLPQRWLKARKKLNLHTPFNFVSTADIIGGNSGSPVVNRAGEFVGIIFDGNIQSLVTDFAYSDEQVRAVSVCSTAIIEALRKVYDADSLAQELLSGHRPR